MVVFLVYLLFPGMFADHTIETETYILMAAWSILGLFFFNRVIRKDHARKFGRAIVVWIALLAFIVVMAMTWAERLNESRENVIVNEISDYMDGTGDSKNLAKSNGSVSTTQTTPASWSLQGSTACRWL